MIRAENDRAQLKDFLGEYHHMPSNDEEVGVILPQSQDEFIDDAEQGQEVFIPTVTKYGLVEKYRSHLVKRIQKKKVENEENLFIRTNSNATMNSFDVSKGDMTTFKNDLETFFRKKGTDISGKSGSKNTKTMSIIQEIINDEFPYNEDNQVPIGQELVKIGKKEDNQSLYSPGDWVEIKGNDMIWRLDMVTRAIKQAPNDWDWNDPKNEGIVPRWRFTYNAGRDRNINEEDLRAPEAGLKYLFGCRPWVWQQWAILKVEEKLRFQLGHQNDFASKDIQKLAADLWDQWLNHPANLEFYNLFYDERIGDKGRAELINHIQKPFENIDKMVGENNSEWDFPADDDINVFTYLSLLGSGLLIPIVVFAVQIAIPVFLIMDSQKRLSCSNGDPINHDVILAKMMAFTIFLYYLYSIIPDTYYTFFNVTGAAESVYSRILSIRRKVWNQGDDSLLQMIGFKVDIYMNTVYKSLLMMLNIYVILVTEEVIEIVLNALAFIFIAKIDEEIAKSGWYDKDKRWLTAGAIATAMQGTIELRVLSSAELFSKKFDIHQELLLAICDNDPNLLHNKKIAITDCKDPTFMTTEEQISMMCAEVAHQTRNHNALEEYHKKDVYFGLIETMLGSFGLSYSRPIFERFASWRCWSRWEKLLFLSPVPILEDIIIEDVFTGVPVLNPHVNKELVPPYANFFPDDSRSAVVDFIRHFVSNLLFQNVLPSLKPLFSLKYSLGFAFRLFDGIILNWLCYFVHVIFPLYLLAAFVDVIYNLLTSKCLFSFTTVIRLIYNALFNGKQV